jgi:hypothetical protein
MNFLPGTDLHLPSFEFQHHPDLAASLGLSQPYAARAQQFAAVQPGLLGSNYGTLADSALNRQLLFANQQNQAVHGAAPPGGGSILGRDMLLFNQGLRQPASVAHRPEASMYSLESFQNNRPSAVSQEQQQQQNPFAAQLLASNAAAAPASTIFQLMQHEREREVQLMQHEREEQARQR